MIEMDISQTKKLGAQLASMQIKGDESPALAFDKARKLSQYLGALVREEGVTDFVFWLPEVFGPDPEAAEAYLEILLPSNRDPKEFIKRGGKSLFTLVSYPLKKVGEIGYISLSGIQSGSRDVAGDFYRIRLLQKDGQSRIIPDPMAESLPFGAKAPGEIYNRQQMLDTRKDTSYFQGYLPTGEEEIHRVKPPLHMLEIHPGTASREKTFAGLDRIYAQIETAQRTGSPLLPWQQAYSDYDAIQLMPVEPAILHQDGSSFWKETEASGEEVLVDAAVPDTINWGYDIITVGSAALNPVYLESKRPDEFLDLITRLHSLPKGPVKVVLDVVFGHLDNQALELMNMHWFLGPNMYGQDVNYRHPMVRAMILEMLCRKAEYGIDGIRIDGAQDFKVIDPQGSGMIHDDDFLSLINEIEITAGGVTYKPWMIFEDGRPWPRDDWELASTYREITKKHPNVVQWGPLTFAHNTPYLYTFWATKWWRVKEVCRYGGDWITGTSNHDTLRRGSQADPGLRINSYLGSSLREIFFAAYDNPAFRLFDTFMPGIPMDFLQANLRTPWSFFRNTDTEWAAKIMCEELNFLDWMVNEEIFAQADLFPRLKDKGFSSLGELKRFVAHLANFLEISNYDTALAADLMNSNPQGYQGPAQKDPQGLITLAKCWMEDVRDLCCVEHFYEGANRTMIDFAAKLRHFRKQNPWLAPSFKEEDRLGLVDCDSAVVYWGVRQDPSGSGSLMFLANMEGEAKTLRPMEIFGGQNQDIQNLFTTPGLKGIPSQGLPEEIILSNAQGCLWKRNEDQWDL